VQCRDYYVFVRFGGGEWNRDWYLLIWRYVIWKIEYCFYLSKDQIVLHSMEFGLKNETESEQSKENEKMSF
jgi:hypothetical protein